MMGNKRNILSQTVFSSLRMFLKKTGVLSQSILSRTQHVLFFLIKQDILDMSCFFYGEVKKANMLVSTTFNDS